MGNNSQEIKENSSRFSQILSQLRKERGISQKKAAGDLGISQALLSHYEKGIRECGLDFVVKCSEYYGVTTDYLLGVSNCRNGINTSSINLPQQEDGISINSLGQATSYLLSIISNAKDKLAVEYIYDYYTLCVYRGAVTMARAGLLPKELFRLDYSLGRELANAVISVEDAKFTFIEDKSRTGTDFDERTALHTVIENAEEKIIRSFYLE